MRISTVSVSALLVLCAQACSSSSAPTSVELPRARALGAPCESSADCEPVLFCNVDALDDAFERQCTAPCDANQPCEASLGPTAVCLLSNLCVRACTTDADCPAGTACNDNFWCKRVAAAPIPTTLHCTGTALGCAAIKGTATSCSDVPGCASAERCVGEPEACSSQGLDCPSGCKYDISFKGCIGAPDPCSTYSTHRPCNDVRGCTWDFFCVGTPRPCELLTAAVCEKEPGCTLQ